MAIRLPHLCYLSRSVSRRCILNAALRIIYCASGSSTASPLTFGITALADRLAQNKTYVLVYKCLHQTAPSYLGEMCPPLSTSVSRSHLRSAARDDLVVPRAPERLVIDRDRSFAGSGLSGPTPSLPPTGRNSSLTLTRFCALSKTMLFCRAYQTLPQRLCNDCCANTVTCLLYIVTDIKQDSESVDHTLPFAI